MDSQVSRELTEASFQQGLGLFLELGRFQSREVSLTPGQRLPGKAEPGQVGPGAPTALPSVILPSIDPSQS